MLYALEPYKDGIISIKPFKKAVRYRFSGDKLTAAWEYSLPGDGEGVSWRKLTKRNTYYFILEEQLWLFYKKDEGWHIVSINIDSGRQLWDRRIPGLNKGYFVNLSNPARQGGNVYFIFTVSDTDKDVTLGRVRTSQWMATDSRLLCVEKASGAIKSVDALPSLNDPRTKLTIVETDKNLIYSISGKFLEWKRK
jgi:hypothetical protein